MKMKVFIAGQEGMVGNAVYNIIWSFLEGMLTAQDTLAAYTYGKKDMKG